MPEKDYSMTPEEKNILRELHKRCDRLKLDFNLILDAWNTDRAHVIREYNSHKRLEEAMKSAARIHKTDAKFSEKDITPKIGKAITFMDLLMKIENLEDKVDMILELLADLGFFDENNDK